MEKTQFFVTVVHMFIACASINCDTWKLFKKIENVDRQTCTDSDSVFTKIQIFDKSACLFECVTRSNCQSVFHGQYTGDCIGCVASFDISNQPTGQADHLQYYWQPSCPDGWSNFENSCYLITETRMTFQAGVATCQSLNARAVIIDGEEENNYLKTLIRSTMTSYTDDISAFYTGFTDMVTENVWVEYGTSNQLTFQDWAIGEPNLGIIENCLAWYLPVDLKWVDCPCNWLNRMVCEKGEF